MNVSGFITSLVTSFIIFVVLLILRGLLCRRPSNAVIYYPAKILNNITPPSNPGFFSWITEAYSASEDYVVQHAGLDAAVYIIFLGSCLSICFYTAIYAVPVLMPLSGTDDAYEIQKRLNSSVAFSAFDKVAMGNIQLKSARIWAFAIGAYWLTIAVFLVLWRTYRRVVLLRARYQSTERARPEQFAVLVRDIPRPTSGTTVDEVDTFFRKLHPESYERCLVASNIDKASKIWTKLETNKAKLAHAEAVFAESKKRPTNRTGPLGLVGKKVDTIDYCNEEIEKLMPKLEKEQQNACEIRQQGAAIVLFNNRMAATSAAQAMHGQFANCWTVSPAPEPREVVWKNLPIPFVQRLVRQFAVYGIVFLTVVFYMIPIVFISAFISLDNLEKRLKFLKPVVEQKEVNAILQAYLPQLILILFLYFLPKLLYKLSEIEGIPSVSHITRAAAGKYFYFNVFNVFLGVTIGGTLFNALSAFLKNPASIITLLSKSLPINATFFISFVALQFFVGYGLTVCRIVPLIIFHLKRRFLCKTEDEIRDAWAPGGFGYATCVPSDILIMTITLCYATIAPLILPFAIAYFGLGWLINQSQALDVCVPSYESGGRMWPHMHARILAALFVSQLTMIGYFGVKKFVYVPLLIPLPIATVVFAYICRQFFYPTFKCSQLVSVADEVKEVPSVDSIAEAYTPTCLLPNDRVREPEKGNESPSNV